MTKWIRVSDKRTGHQYTVAEHAFEPEIYSKVSDPATDANGNPRPPKHKLPLGGVSKDNQEPKGSEGEKK